MKKGLLFIILFYSYTVFSQSVSMQKAQLAAEAFFMQHNISCSIDSIKPHINIEGDTLYYIVNASPESYALVAADEQVWPVLAWSGTSNFKASLLFLPIVDDYYTAYRSVIKTKYSETQKMRIKTQWKSLLAKDNCHTRVQCWPEAGTTNTEGWIITRWTQTSPYNQLCPNDPISNTRSYAGCPAIVMGQIINYLKTTQNTRFDDNDDYLHDYAGRVYNIDDDYDSLKFPSFPALNTMLDSIDQLFQSNIEAEGKMAAAIVFAAGTACIQVYTSEGSGTFAVNQAFDAYQRFGFENSDLYVTVDSVMYATLIGNLKNGWPAHLALVDQAWNTGHNVIVDGYRDDGYFHINFGWGGQSDGWWLVPDPSFPYSLGVLEGIILNIIPNFSNIEEEPVEEIAVIFPNPATDTVFLKSKPNVECKYEIYSVNGQLVQSGYTMESIPVSNLNTGVYILKLQSDTGIQVAKLVIN